MSSPSPPKAETMPVEIGQVIDGRFRVERIIGEGAIGFVMEATHLELKERVAMKFLRPSERGRKDQVTRFAREARAAARLKGEHIARVLDVGELPTGDPYMVMELLEGRDLERHIAEVGPMLNLATAALYMIQACEALAEAHSLDIIHRDIKPANLFLFERPGSLPMLKLLDFGISKAALTGEYTNVALAETKTTTIMGTPYYMAPEQVRSTRDVDSRADLWALGAVMFELVSGETMWRSSDLGTLVQEILNGEPRTLAQVRPDLTPRFAEALAGALERDPDRRYPSAAAFARALLPFAPPTAQVHVERAERFTGSSKHAIPAALRTAVPKALTSSTNGAIEAIAAEPPPAPGSRIFAFAVGVSALLVLGAATAILAPRFLASPAAPAAAASRPAAPTAAPTIHVNLPPTTAAAPPVSPDPTPGPSTGRPPGAFRPIPVGSVGARGHPNASLPNATLPPRPVDPPPVSPPIPPPAESGSRAGRPSMDDNPWQKTEKQKLDDNPFNK